MDKQDLQNLFQMQLPIKDGEYWDGRPRAYSNLKQWWLKFSQQFGTNPAMYAQFNLAGHNGVDIAGKTGTPIVAPIDMWITYTKDTDEGYGRSVRAETETRLRNGEAAKLEMVFGHFSGVIAEPYRWAKQGELIGLMGSTGFSTGPHLHFGIRPHLRLNNGSFRQLEANNGFLGYIDPEPFMPHMVWDWNELNMENYDKKLIRNSKTGELGWFYDNFLRTAKTDDRFALMLGSYIHRNFGGITIDDPTWQKLLKKDF